MTNLEDKIKDAYLDNRCDVEDITYEKFERIARYFYGEGKKDLLDEMDEMADLPINLSELFPQI